MTAAQPRKKAKAKLNTLMPTLLLVLVFLVGLAVVLYPAISDLWNSTRQSRAIVNYETAISQLTLEQNQAMFETAEKYNAAIAELEYQYVDYKQLYHRQDLPLYDDILNIGIDGIMSYITVPRLNSSIAVYHGTSDAVLNVAVGHIEGSSLPVGGKSTHCVLSAHRGLPSAKLFSDLDKMELGDTFTLRTLDRVLTYEVDQILIVLPNEMEPLCVSEGEDLCTLVTCTPYGINTHRILVRGHAIDTVEEVVIHVPADAVLIDELIVASILVALLLLLVYMFAGRKKERKRS